MSISLEARRRDIARTIARNPTTITIVRTTKVRSGGGFAEIQSQAGPFTVRIFGKRPGAPRLTSNPLGDTAKGAGWGMLANHQADIRAGQDVTDEFDTLQGRFRVAAVRPQIVDSDTAGYQCDLERIG